MTGWDELSRELDRWTECGRTATFWWRDDDATDATPALERLRQASGDIPVGLAVVPAAASPALADAVRPLPGWRALQHGWSHTDHASGGEKKAEFGPHRTQAAMLTDLEGGRERMSTLFGDRFLPVLVPPWNRIDVGLVARLPAAGYAGLSTFADRSGTGAGLVCRDCHLDPIDWRGSRGFVGAEAAIAVLLTDLRRRRREDLDRPTGLLTHHLVMDEPAWEFCTSLRTRTALHTAVRWISPTEAFGMEA